MLSKAIVRYVRISPQKVHPVVRMIKGMQVEHALNVLKFCKKKSARIVEKLIHSAIANAENISRIKNMDDVYIKEVYVGPGSTFKRIRPAARGRACLVRKRTSHITVILDEKTTP